MRRGVATRLLVEPARPGQIRNLPSAPWLAVATVCVGAFMGQLDASIVTIALPSIGRELHAGLGAIEWVVLAYVLVIVAAVAGVGRLADSFGRKLPYVYGFAVFILGSVACAVAPSLPLLVAARVVQGVGAVLLQANSVALIRDVLPERSLGTGLGVQGAAQAIGLAAGPAAGGALIAAGGWRLVFLINVPIGLVGMILGWLLLPRSRSHIPARSIDIAGILLPAGAVAAALAALSLATSTGVSRATIAALSAVALACAAGAWLRERRQPGTVVDPVIGHSPGFFSSAASAALAYVVLFGVLFSAPFYLESAGGLSAKDAGLWLTALPMGIALVAPVGGVLRDRLGSDRPSLGGLMLVMGGLAWLAAGPARATAAVPALALIGAGMGLFIPANNAAIMTRAPASLAGSAGGLVSMIRGLGIGFGVAATGLIFGIFAGQGVASVPLSAAAGVQGMRAGAALLAAVVVLAGALTALRPNRRGASDAELT